MRCLLKYSLLSMSPSLVLQLLLLLLRPPGSLPADDSLPFPELLSLCALGLAHIGLAPEGKEKMTLETSKTFLPISSVEFFESLIKIWTSDEILGSSDENFRQF